MASNRWVAIDPDILTHPLVGAGQPVAPADPTRGAYSRMEAWVWIICNASFADHTVMNRGRKMTLRRGDLLGAWAYLAHTFNWSAKTVRVWIERLIADNMLQRRALEGQRAANLDANNAEEPETFYGNQSTILSIVNYWRFQFDEAPEGQPRGNHQGNQQGNQSDPLSVSEIADKYILQQQQGQPVGQPKGQHITIEDINKESLSESSPTDLSGAANQGAKPKRRRRAAEYSETFEAFWWAYPDRHNNSKPRAFEEWELLTEAEQNAAMASMPAFVAYCRKNPDYRVVHVERYLKGKRWESFLPAPGRPDCRPWWQDPAQVAAIDDDRWRRGIATYANGVWNPQALGPPPGHPECKVPAHLIEELHLTEIYDERGLKRR
jgi:hypothetical protein